MAQSDLNGRFSCGLCFYNSRSRIANMPQQEPKFRPALKKFATTFTYTAAVGARFLGPKWSKRPFLQHGGVFSSSPSDVLIEYFQP